MREKGHKGESRRSIGNLVWLPLVVALLAQYALAAPMLGSNGAKASDISQAGAPAVTYEVTVTPNGQVQASSAKEDASALDVNDDLGGSAAEAFLQAAGEDDAVNALRDERQSPLEAARSRIAKEAAAAKLAKRQANKERGEQLRIGALLKEAPGLDDLKVRGYDISYERMAQLVDDPPNYTANIEYIDQNGLLPSGCEIVALTVALHSMGYDDADPIEIADKYIEYGGDSAKYFTGSPYSDGGGFPPCIVDAANKWLKDNGGGAKAYDLTGSSFEGLCALVELGYPVLVWSTDSMTEPYVGSEWYQPEHCVVMYGLEKSADGKAKADEAKAGKDTVSSSAAAKEKSESASSAASAASATSAASAASAASTSKESASRSASASSPAASSSAAPSSSSASSSKSSSSSAAASSAKDSSNSAASRSASASSSSASSSKSSKAVSSTSSSSAKSSGPSSSAGASSKSATAQAPKSSNAAASSSAASPSAASASASSASPGSSSASASSQGSSKPSSSSSAAKVSPYAKVLVSDSLAGLVKRDYDDFKRIYEKAGQRALFIQPDKT